MASALRRLGQAVMQNRPRTQNTVFKQQQRGFAADVEHGEQKVHFWQAPTQVSKWKEEELVVTIMMGASWAIGFYGLYQFAVKKAGMQYARDPANLELYKKRA